MITSDLTIAAALIVSLLGYEWVVWRWFSRRPQPSADARVPAFRERWYWIYALMPVITVAALSVVLLVGTALIRGAATGP